MTTPSLIETIGNTPLIRLSHFSEQFGVEILAKQESRNPMGSIKDRVALYMIEAAERDGSINSNSTIIEPTSGNTGLGLACVCAAKKLRLILTMPSSMSVERRALLKHLGAELFLTEATDGMKGAIAKAEELKKQIPNSFIPNQFNNPSCPEAHRQTTAPEIWQQTNGNIDFFISGVGTGGTITGVAEYIKERNPGLYAVAVEPKDSAVLSGQQPSPHKIQGIGAGFVPAVLNRKVIDEILTVSNEDSFATAQLLARTEGLLCGISSGAALWATLEIAKRVEGSGKTLVTIFPDTGERYLSTALIE